MATAVIGVGTTADGGGGKLPIRAASTDDPEAQGMMRVVAAGYEKLARRIERRIREAVEV